MLCCVLVKQRKASQPSMNVECVIFVAVAPRAEEDKTKFRKCETGY